jgi:hydroxymethylpyrimidine pyrophosphatase-like HAD family hydrolase
MKEIQLFDSTYKFSFIDGINADSIKTRLEKSMDEQTIRNIIKEIRKNNVIYLTTNDNDKVQYLIVVEHSFQTFALDQKSDKNFTACEVQNKLAELEIDFDEMLSVFHTNETMKVFNILQKIYENKMKEFDDFIDSFQRVVKQIRF